MKYFITGVPGSGKTTIGKLLKTKGYEFADSDYVSNLANWYNSKTGKLAQQNTHDDAEWYRQHSWNWDRAELKELLRKYKDSTFFLCGMTTNQAEDFDLFDKVFVLTATAKELRIRMLQRNDIVDEESIDTVFDWHDSFEKEMIRKGAISIDASQSPDEIVDEILKEIL